MLLVNQEQINSKNTNPRHHAVALSPKRGRTNSYTLDSVTKHYDNTKVTNSIPNNKANINSNYLNCFYTNATSLVNKWNCFISHMSYLNLPHIIMVTETWFNEKSIVTMNNYNIHVKNRNSIDSRRGGGVVIYVRNYLISTEICDPILNCFETEIIWCSVDSGGESTLVGCIYRPHHSSRDINQSITQAINQAAKLCDQRKFSNLLVTGDFNHADLLWHERSVSYKPNGRASSIEFADCLNDNFLSQVVDKPTFSNSVLDLVITNDPTRIYEVEYRPPLGYSHQNQLHCSLN